MGCQTFWVALTAIGTIAMATATFITLRKNSKDNIINHQLQLNVLNYQQQMQWMDRLRDVCIKNIYSYDIADLMEAICIMQVNLNEANRTLVKFMVRMEKTDTEVAFIGQNNNAFRNKYHTSRKKTYQELITVVKDMHAFLVILINNKPQSKDELIESLNSYKNVSAQFKTMVQEYDFINDTTMIVSAFNILDKYLANIFSYFETVRDFTQEYLRKEQEQIDKILIDVI